MGNQQERSLAWFAGILDGEGTISVQVYTLPDGRVRLTPFACIVNSDPGILQGCRDVLAEIGVASRDCNKASSDGRITGMLKCLTIRIDGQKPVKRLCQAIAPYLRSSKRRNAQVVIAYINSRELRGMERDELGRIRRVEYNRAEIEMIASIRVHPRAKSSEAICRAPNVVG